MAAGRISPADVAEAWQEIMRTEEGRVVLSDLQARFGFTSESTFDPNPATMAFKEGQRAAMIYIGKMLSTDPQALRDRLEGNG